MPELVQPIAVQPTTHEATVMAAALASATMLGHALREQGRVFVEKIPPARC